MELLVEMAIAELEVKYRLVVADKIKTGLSERRIEEEVLLQHFLGALLAQDMELGEGPSILVLVVVYDSETEASAKSFSCALEWFDSPADLISIWVLLP